MHKGKQVKAWLANHPRFQFHHQPVHCSWMNQVEQWFSNDSPHLEYKQRWVNQYNFYINDAHWGRMFVRMYPYFPFSARICLNQHHWLALRMRREGIDFEQTSNAFLKCGNPIRLQRLADSLTSRDLSMCGQKWLAMLSTSAVLLTGGDLDELLRAVGLKTAA